MAKQFLNTYDIEKYVKACCDGAGLNVVYEDPSPGPRTDGKTMWLPKLTAADSDDYASNLKQWVKHETSHKKWSYFKGLGHMTATPRQRILHNVLEDHRVDTLNDAIYYGDRQHTETYLEAFADKTKANLPKMNEFQKELTPLITWEIESRNYLHRAADAAKTIEDDLGKAGKDVLKRLRKYTEELEALRKIEDAEEGFDAGLALANKISKELWPEDPPMKRNKKKEEGDGNGEGDKKKGKGQCEDGNGNGEGEGKGEKAGGKGGKPGDVKLKGEQKDDAEEVLLYPSHIGEQNDDEWWTPCKSPTARTRNIFDPKLRDSEGYRQPLEQDIRKIDFKNTHGRNGASADGGHMQRVLLDGSVKEEGFANRVRTELQILSQARWDYSKKRGTLHRGSVYKVAVPDSPGADRLFKRRHVGETLDTSVQLIVDFSGSMSGDKLYNACRAALLLNKALSTTLHIPVEIVGFTEQGRTPVHFIFKSFSDPMISSEELARRFSIASRELSNNSDGVMVMWSYNRIIKQRTKRKLMIVLSDGCPADSGARGNIHAYTKEVVEYIEKKTPVEIMGVGLCDTSVRHFYKNNVVINRQDEIAHKLIEIVRKNIVKGK